MIRRKLAPLLLALGLMGGVTAVAFTPQPAAAAVVTTLTNGYCTVKVGFISGVAWMQTWNNGCRYIGILACDSGCYNCANNTAQAVNYNGLPAFTYIQSKAINGRSAWWAFVSTIDKHGWTRDGVVNPLGQIVGW
jgi:hypothetical protein